MQDLGAEKDQLLMEILNISSEILPSAFSSGKNHASKSQERLYWIEKLFHSAFGYNMVTAVVVNGELNVPLLHECFRKIVSRHDMLRTGFYHEEGEVFLKTLESIEFEINEKRLIGFSEDEIRKVMIDEARGAFNIETSPLFRFSLYKIDEDKQILLFTIHHIIADGQSINIIFCELCHLYNSLSKGEIPQLNQLPFSYAEFAWQQRIQFEKNRAEILAYWNKQFETLPDQIIFPNGDKNQILYDFKGKTEYFEIGITLSKKIKCLAKDYRTTPYVILLSLFGILLRCYTGVEDFLIGMPVSERSEPGTESLVGLLLNTLPIRLFVDNSKSYEQFLDECKAVVTEALSNSKVSFDCIMEILSSRTGQPASSLVNILFNMQIEAEETLYFDGVSAEMFQLDIGAAKFDLSLHVGDTINGYKIGFEYKTQIFHNNQILRMAANYITLLSFVIDNPCSHIGELRLVSKEEYQLTVNNWGIGKSYAISEDSYIDIFHKCAMSYPQRVAISCMDKQITYGELDCRSNQLAAYLIQNNYVLLQTGVGIFCRRSINTLIAILAVGKAGGYYVPLEKSYPTTRLQTMIEDIRLKCIITDSLTDDDSMLSSLKVLDLDTAIKQSQQLDPTYISYAKGDLPIYALFSSGSTGKPKGILISHRSIVNFIKGMEERINFKDSQRFLLLTNLSFDISVLELFFPLALGKEIIVATEEEQIDAQKIIKKINSHHIDVLQITPSRFSLLMEEGCEKTDYLQILKYIIFAGEPVQKAGVTFAKKYSKARVFDFYGPTETTVFSTGKELTDCSGDTTVGTPIANTYIYVLNQYHLPVPIGVAGELYIGGLGVFLGYINRPELTQEKKQKNPFHEGDFIYATGDIAVWTDYGEIRLLGRKDNQIKLNGYRIELEEIEKTIESSLFVDKCVVSLIKEKESFLVAHYTSSLNIVEKNELMEYLSKKLPHYMLPRYFIRLDDFPINSNGKIDRNNPIFQSYEQTDSADQEKQEASEVVYRVSEIWKSVLKKEHVYHDENFFSLGGTSARLVEVYQKISDLYPDMLSITDLFVYTTVNSLAAAIQKKMNENNDGNPYLNGYCISLENYNEQEFLEEICITGRMDDYDMQMLVSNFELCCTAFAYMLYLCGDMDVLYFYFVKEKWLWKLKVNFTALNGINELMEEINYLLHNEECCVCSLEQLTSISIPKEKGTLYPLICMEYSEELEDLKSIFDLIFCVRGNTTKKDMLWIHSSGMLKKEWLSRSINTFDKILAKLWKR